MTMTRTERATSPPVAPIRHREAMFLAREAYERFGSVVSGLADDDWSRPTDCEGWAVRDLVAHMVGAMRAAASPREQVSQQREIKARVTRDGGSTVDVMTKVQIERLAGSSNTQLAAECSALVPKASAGRRRIPAPLRRLVRFDVEMGSIHERWRLGYLIDIILTRDAWLHRIDLCRAIGQKPELTADHDGRIVADVVSEWARRHGRPFELVLSGPAGGTFTSGPADGRQQMTLDAVELCRILSGRAPGTGLLATEVPF